MPHLIRRQFPGVLRLIATAVRVEAQQKHTDITSTRLPLRRLCVGLALTACMLTPAIGGAQQPWKVTIKPAMIALRVGYCAPVYVTVLDTTTNRPPRNRLGAAVTIADFDMTVAAGGLVVGLYSGASFWSACACPASAGAVATITATYPARSLAQKARVRGVASFRSSITVPVVDGKLSGVPIGCETYKTKTVPAGSGVPWTVTLTSNASPLPIGTCSLISIDLRDATGKEDPRNLAAQRVSLADFDMTVAAAGGGAVVGQYNGPSLWSACACQGATVGELATITATYPASALAERARVPDVAFQSSITIPLAAARGTFNPPACASSQKTAVAVAPPFTKTIAVPPPAPAPTGVTVTGIPTSVKLEWEPVAGVTSYVVTRQQGFAPEVPATQHTLAPTNKGMYDTGLFPATLYTWTIRAIQADGRGGSTNVSFITPAYPTEFKVEQLSPGKVLLTWKRTPGSPKWYRVMGSGRPPGGTLLPGALNFGQTYLQISNLAEGPYSWQVIADYGGGGPYETAGMPTASIWVTTVRSPAPLAANLATTAVLSPRFRVSILGFTAIVETNDDLLSRDGKNNEVYAAATVCDAIRQEPTDVKCTLVRSAVHGDVNGFPGRVKAGTGSVSGGITSGNSVGAGPLGATAGSTSTFPFVLWQGTLLPGKEAVWIAPSLWESGGVDNELLSWYGSNQSYLDNSYRSGGPAGMTAEGASALGGGFVAVSHSFSYPTIPRHCAHLEPGNDRPIGLAPPFNPSSPFSLPGVGCKWIGLTREKAEAVLGGAPQEAGKPVGVLTWNLPDAVSGHYVMYLKLERLP